MRGLPFWVGEVKFQNKLTIALISLDLEPLGFAQFQHVLEANRKRYCSLDLGKRVKLARSFAMGYAILEKLGFLHADVNTENVFINLETCEVLLIDFDAGVLRVNGDELPQTPGKPNEFLAPEIKNAAGVDISKFNEAAELWSVGFMIHTLIFGVHPPCCMDRGCGRTEPNPCSGSCDADILWASEVQHTVQHVGGDRHLARLTPVRLEAQPVTDDAFPS